MSTIAVYAQQYPAVTYAISPPGGAHAFTADEAGNVYIAGPPNPTFRTTPGVAYPEPPANPSSFLVKLDPNGNVVFATYLPGVATALLVNREGAAFVISVDRVDNPWADKKPSVVSFNPAGTAATAHSIPVCTPSCGLPQHAALDGEGNLYIASYSQVPVTADAFRLGPGGEGLFVLKMNPRTGAVLYVSHLGPVSFIAGLAVDNAGSAYVAGETESTDFPVTPNAYMTTPPGPRFSFVSKLNPTGSALVYSTYLRPFARGIAVDASGAAFVGVGGIAKLSPDGSSLLFSSSLSMWTVDVKVDRFGNSIVAGYTSTIGFPQVNSIVAESLNTVRVTTCEETSSSGQTIGYPCYDAALVKFDRDGKLIWSSALGTAGNQAAYRVSADAAGNLYAAISNFPGLPLPGMSGGLPGSSASILKIEPVGPPPLIKFDGIVSSAHFKRALDGDMTDSTAIGSGGLVSIFGTGLTDAEGIVTAPSVPLPTTLAETSVWFGQRKAPILAVAKVNGQEQVNVLLPALDRNDPNRPGGSLIVKKGRVLGFSAFRFSEAWASIFLDSAGKPLITHADFSRITAENPARAGETIVIWATGLGWVDPPVRDGDAAPVSPLARTVTPPVVRIGGQNGGVLFLGGENARVVFSGLTPGFVGLYQVNAVVPPVPPGEHLLALGAGNFVHDTARIAVQ